MIKSGYSLSSNSSSAGVRELIIAGVPAIASLEAGEVGLFNIGPDDWHIFECLGDCSLDIDISRGKGGLIYTSSIRYAIRGLSQAKISVLRELLDSSGFGVVVRLNNGLGVFISPCNVSSGVIKSGSEVVITSVSDGLAPEVSENLIRTIAGEPPIEPVDPDDPTDLNDYLLDRNNGFILDRNNERIILR